MTTINLKKYTAAIPLSVLAAIVATLVLWLYIEHLQNGNALIGTMDPGILQVVALAITTWLVLLAIALSVMVSILSKLQNLVEPFKKITSWQQHIIYLALFAVLVLSGTGCLIAIC